MRQLGLIFLISFLFACNTPIETPPNIILIMADDLGYGDLSCYGNTAYQTPNIDRLAKEGQQFFNFHSNGVVCSPTRAALMTGRYPQRSGIEAVVTAANHRNTGFALSEFTLAEYLKSVGYTTAMFGKWHLGYDTLYSPINQGFDIFKGFVSGNVDYHSHIDQAGHFDWWMNKDTLVEEGYTTDLFTQASLDYIETHTDKPFFLYLAHEAPHYPYQGRKDTADRTVFGKFPNQGSRKDRKNAYQEMVMAMDEGIGKIVDKLEDKNLLDNTLIIFLSDNGANQEGSNAPYRGHKGQMWEGGHRVPAIMYWKNKLALGKNNIPCMSMDIFPTIIGLQTKALNDATFFDGKDLLPLINPIDSSAISVREMHWRYKGKQAMYLAGFKLVRLADKSYFFNLEKDPKEQNDISKSEPFWYNHLDSLMQVWNEEMDKYQYVSQ